MISKFRDDYNYLSNFFSVPITYKGVLYQSVEAAYMAQRCDDIEWKRYCADPMSSAREIKKKSKSVTDRADWPLIKLKVMEDCLRLKFAVPYLRKKLLETGNQNIQEGNEWKDDFWGIRFDMTPNYGENHLGRLLMKIRDEIYNSLAEPLYQDLKNFLNEPSFRMYIGADAYTARDLILHIRNRTAVGLEYILNYNEVKRD